MFTIRKAKYEDITNIVKVHVDSWKTTYKGIVPDQYLNQLTYDSRMQLWENIMEEQKYIVFVAETIEHHIVGFIAINMNSETEGHISSFYLLEQYQGLGIGKKLFTHAIQYFSTTSCTQITVGVLEDNKAKSFYYHLGAKLKDSLTVTIAGKPLTELILQWTMPAL